MSPEYLYPYLVPPTYPPSPIAFDRPLGHGLRVELVRDAEHLVENATDEDLSAIGMSPEQAYAKAVANLSRRIEIGDIEMSRYSDGPGDRPFIVGGYHWAAAASILWPNLPAFAERYLGTSDVLLAIPHREVLLIFPAGDREHREAVRRFVKEKEGDGRKPLTPELFTLSAGQVVPVERD